MHLIAISYGLLSANNVIDQAEKFATKKISRRRCTPTPSGPTALLHFIPCNAPRMSRRVNARRFAPTGTDSTVSVVTSSTGHLGGEVPDNVFGKL